MSENKADAGEASESRSSKPLGDDRGKPPTAALGAGKTRPPADDGGKPALTDKPQQSLGNYLTAAREKRGISRAQLVGESRIPDHYVRMIESNNYSLISDQLYMLPFLRRYAAFLQLDQEEVAMRFVHEVQRADNTPPARLDQPFDVEKARRGRGVMGALVVIGLLAVAGGLYLYESGRHPWAAANAASIASPIASPASN